MSENDVTRQIEQIRQRTGQTGREDRPGWTFQLAPQALGPHLRPGQPDPLTQKQRDEGVELDFVYLTPAEDLAAVAEAARTLAGQQVTLELVPTAVPEWRAKFALWRVDGVEVNALNRSAMWEALGEVGRAMCVGMYNRVHLPQESIAAVQGRAATTFRVRA